MTPFPGPRSFGRRKKSAPVRDNNRNYSFPNFLYVTMDKGFPSKAVDLLLDMVCVVDVEGRYVFVSAACERLLGYTQAELLGRRMIELVHPDDRERTLQAAAEIMSGQPKVHLENRYVRKDGRVVDIMWSARWSEADRLRLAVARDVTDLKRSERKQRALYRISEAAHAADGLPALYQHIHQIIGELLPADNFMVALRDRSNGQLSFPYFIDERTPVPEAQALDPANPIARIIQSGQALLLTPVAASGDSDPNPISNQDDASWLGAPLISQQGIIGALVLKAYSGSTYTEDDRELLQFVSTQIATAIERKQVESRLHHMARYDSLTDLPNRMLFLDRLEMAIKRAQRDHEHLALLYLDFDEFKQINDTFGHEIGDLLLTEVARRLVASVRKSDTVCRIGGDEFTMLLNNIHGRKCVAVIVEKVRAAISAPFEIKDTKLTMSASIGVAVYPEDGEDKGELMRCADAGMYAEKRRRS